MDCEDASRQARGRGKGVRQPLFDKEKRRAAHGKGFAKGKLPKGRGGCERAVQASPFAAGAASGEEIYEDGFRCHQKILEAHAGSITAVCIAAEAVYTASRDKVLRRWKPQQNSAGLFELMSDLEVPLSGACWTMLHLGEWIVCGLDDGRIQAFSKSGSDVKLEKHSKGVSAMLVHQEVLVTGGAEGAIHCWKEEKSTGSFVNTHSVESLIKMQVRCMAVACGRLWVGGSRGVVCLDLETLSRAELIPPEKKVAGILEFQGHIIAMYSDGSSYVFDAAGKTKHSQGPLAAGPVLCVAGLETGPRVLCGHINGKISALALPSFELQTSWQAAQFKCQVRCLESARQNGLFILGAENGDLQVWQRDEALAKSHRPAMLALAAPSGLAAPAGPVKNGAPLCERGHLCSWSAKADGAYKRGWRCNLCKAKKKGERWFCEECMDDLCFECFPLRGPDQRGSDHREAQIVNGKWVQVRKHSAMGCAVVTFTEQKHRDLVIEQLSQSPAVLGGIQVELKPHLEKQVDGTRAEIPRCAFAGWKQPKEEGSCTLLARTLQIYLDRCCEAVNGPADVIALD
eukprot:TRINITY_DN105182_c0_g1_i1.p1 TRINITY_DN105182_c0_g1~~TRINITY_DN105182_c0_g1_i1.p1  ORF type:complete len:579 (+),score=118.84 TRINITY_DN105182_c0_g1_i1:25-1737(+)